MAWSCSGPGWGWTSWLWASEQIFNANTSHTSNIPACQLSMVLTFITQSFLDFFYLHTNLNVGQLLSILSGTRSMQLLCGQCALLFTVCGTVQHFSNTNFSLDNIENISKIAIDVRTYFLAHITHKNCNTIDTKVFGGLLLLFPCVLCIRCVIWDGQLQC